MTKNANILIIDDDASIIRFYQKSFFKFNRGYKVHVVSSCDEAIKEETRHYLFVIIDIKLATKRRNRALSMHDKVKLLKRFFGRSKLVISIPLGYNNVIYKSLVHFRPAAIVIKEDIFLRNFYEFVRGVLSGTPYYSETVREFISRTYAKNLNVDHIDISLLEELNIGTKMKDIPKKTGVSLSAIEKRKRILKKRFELDGKPDAHLIKSAKKYGVI